MTAVARLALVIDNRRTQKQRSKRSAPTQSFLTDKHPIYGGIGFYIARIYRNCSAIAFYCCIEFAAIDLRTCHIEIKVSKIRLQFDSPLVILDS